MSVYTYRVSAIQSRVSQLRTQLFGEVIQKLISKSYIEEGVTVTRRREYVTEIRPTDMNPTFKHVHECLTWVENKQVIWLNPNFLAAVNRGLSTVKHYNETWIVDTLNIV